MSGKGISSNNKGQGQAEYDVTVAKHVLHEDPDMLVPVPAEYDITVANISYMKNLTCLSMSLQR